MLRFGAEKESSATLRSAHEALAMNRREIKAAQARRRRLEKNISNLGIPEATLHLSATIRALAPNDGHIARWPCLRCLEPSGVANKQVGLCLLDQVIEEFMEAHIDLMPPNALDDPASRSRRQRAADLIAQYKLMEYVREENMKQGIAPSSEQLLVRLTQTWPFDEASGIENTGARVSGSTPSGIRRWMSAWRERFGVTFGRLPPGSDLPADTIEKQAGTQKRGTQKWDPAGRLPRGKSVLRYPFLGTKIGSIFGDPEAEKK